MDLESLLKAAEAHPYVLLAFIIFTLVRLMKSDTKFPIDVPPAARKYVAVLLAAGGAVVEKLAMNVPLKQALIHGLTAWFFAEFGHKVLVDDLRGGKELPFPFLMIPGASPSPGKPSTIPPPPKTPNIPPGVTSMLGALILAIVLAGCAKFWKVADLAADKVQCLVANQDLPNETLWLKCAIEEPERYLELLESARAETKRAVARERERAASDRSDAGACEAGK